jgi:two-component system OmpR family response regulator
MTGDYRVLVVEDSEVGGRTLQTVLAAAGFDVRWEMTAADGLAAAREWGPAAVLLDRHLPDADGATLARRFGGADRRVVVLSGDPRPKGVRGVHRWLVKPVTNRELIAALGRSEP